MSRLAIIARVQLTAEDAPKYIEGAKKLIEPTRSEPGCELYGMAVDFDDPTIIWISEQWESKAHLDDHLRTAHVQEFLGVAANLSILDMEARQYTVSELGSVEMPE